MARKLIALALAVVMAALLIPAVVAADSGWIMYVYTDNGKTLNVRRDPMVADNIIGQLKFGEAVSVRMTTSNGWACIDWSSGEVAYVQSRFLVNSQPGIRPAPSGGGTAPATTDAAKILTDMNAEFRSARQVVPFTVTARPTRASGWVNLRWAPSTESERIATCPQGKELTVLAEMKNWYQVQDPMTGMIGFISRKYVSKQ